MSLPEIKEIPGGYNFKWNGNEQIQIKVNRLRSHSDGRLNGEILVTTTAPGYNPHLHLGQFNFTASRSRKELAKQLTEEYPVDWENILEQLVVYTLERARRGDPVEELMVSDNEEMEPPKYILEPFIIENYPTIFFGDPGSFKSTMSIIVMACVTLPWAENPLGLITQTRHIKVLMLDWETDKATIKWQLACFQKGMGLGVIPISYRRCSLPLYDDLEQIQNAIYDTQSELIVIDSLGLACGGELNEAGTAIRFFSALRQLKVPSLILAHTSKDKQSSTKSVYGSVYFEAQARSIWHLKKRQDAGENELDLVLRNTKSPPFRKKYSDMAYHVKFDECSMKVKIEDPKSVAEFLENMGTQDRILESLKESLKTPKELAEELGITPENARVTLFNLKKKGLISKSKDSDRYSITDKNHVN